jgi:hydroxypyruvate reductase
MRVFAAGLSAVDPMVAVGGALVRDGELLSIAGRQFDLSEFDRCCVLSFGKASVPMASAAAAVLHDQHVEGVVVSNDPQEIRGLEVLTATHPVPDQRSILAAHRLVEMAASAGARDLVIVLISGGGSALLTLPAEGIGLTDLAATTRELLRCGATIDELNTVRKHLSAVKGGRLAETLAGAGSVSTLVVSDVIGDDLSVIASGPMVPDPTTFGDALAVLDRYQLRADVPSVVVDRLLAGAAGEIKDTPSDGAVFDEKSITVVASAADAAAGAISRAAADGWEASLVTTTLAGEAREVAETIVNASRDLAPGQMLVYAGETTVTVRGDGAGGRNQELALAAAIELVGDDGIVLLSGGTDGIDGMSDAAGGIVDGLTVARGKKLGLDAADHLARNDSNSYLAAVGDVIVTGPTGTNVGDLILVARSG